MAISSLTALAQEPTNPAEVDALLQSSYTGIDGRATPELIPYHVRMAAFFESFPDYAPQFRSQLIKADFDQLQRYASAHGAFQKQDGDRQLREWQEVAARAEPMSAVEIATELKQSSRRIEAVAAARYRATLDALSADGRAVIDRFIADRVRPNTSIEDPLVVAMAAPVFYKTQILGTYKMMQEGKWPPAPPVSNTKRVESMPAGDAARVGSK